MELGPLGMEPWGDIEPPLASAGPDPRHQHPLPAAGEDGRAAGLQLPQPERRRNSLRYIHKRIGEHRRLFRGQQEPAAGRSGLLLPRAGRRPELWWPDTGRIERVAVYDEADGVTRVPIRLEPERLGVRRVPRGRARRSRIASWP